MTSDLSPALNQTIVRDRGQQYRGSDSNRDLNPLTPQNPRSSNIISPCSRSYSAPGVPAVNPNNCLTYGLQLPGPVAGKRFRAVVKRSR